MLYFVYRDPQLETGDANRFPDAIAEGFTLNLGQPVPNAEGVTWRLAAREDDDAAVITALPYPTKIIGVAADNDVEYVAPWLRAWKYGKLGAAADAAAREIIALVPDFQTKLWDTEETEAAAWTVDNTAATPTLDTLCTARGMDKAALVADITTKATAYRLFAADNLGKLQALGDRIWSPMPLAEMMDLQWT